MKCDILKIISLLLVFLIGFSLTGCVSSEGDYDDSAAIIERSTLDYPANNGEFKYDVYTEYVSISKYIGDATNVEIPSELEDLPVLSIRSEAFKDNTSIKSVTIPEPVYMIGSEAFRGCKSLKSINLSDTVKVLKSDCFRGCDSLQELILPKGVENIPSGMCSGCDSLYSVEIKESKYDESLSYTVSDSAFGNCPSLYSVYIPKRYTKIDGSAFDGSMDKLVIYGYGSGAIAKFCSENLIDFVVLDAEKYKAIREESKKKYEQEVESRLAQQESEISTGETASEVASREKETLDQELFGW